MRNSMDWMTIASCVFLAAVSTASRASIEGKYWYNWGNETHVFETLPEAEESLRSHGAPADRFTRISHAVDKGREVFYYEVPYRVDPVDMVTLYSSSPALPSCNLPQSLCSTEEEAAERILEFARHSWGMCVLDSDIEGEWETNRYSSGGRPHPDERVPGFHNFRTGKFLHFYTKSKSGDNCHGLELEYHRSIYKIDYYYCPDGYSGVFSDDRQEGWCMSSWKQKIYGPLSGPCEISAGNPCGIQSGVKSESESDIVADDLEFTRTYQSSQLN